MDKLIFLGTAGDSSMLTRRQGGGFVVQTDEMQFVIDPGTGALTNAVKNQINPRLTTAILVSHNHVNHAGDLNAFVNAATHNGLDRQAVAIVAKSLVELSPENYPMLSPFHRECVEKVIIAEEGKKVGINKAEIHAIKAKHGSQHSVGFKILVPKFTLAYSGDTEYFKEMEELYKNVDILVLNVQEPFGKKSSGHLNCDDVVKILKATKPNLCVITHYGAKLLQQDALEIGRQIHRETNVQVITAKDNMVLNPASYSRGTRQKTLNVYN